jgi:trehalose synthase
MQQVALRARGVDEYADVIGSERHAELRKLAAELRGARVVHVNATAYGGGVAEILHNLAPLMRDVGLDASWSVLEAPAEFYDVTKRIHNALQGMPLDLSDDQMRLFLDIQRENSAALATADFVVAHDPQTVALVHHARNRGGSWIWRCHIDLTTAHPPVWSFLRPYIEEHDAAIFTMPQFVQPDLRMDRVVTIAPAIDPLSTKNRDMPLAEARAIVARFGFDPDDPLLVQISRFDPWKDPLGVIDAYRLVEREIPDVQLAMIGSLAADDPEGKDYLARTLAHAGDDPDVRCLTNLDGVGDIEVNAFQRVASVAIQKSLREGFGLTVSEALWKGVPVVGGAVGGIPLQIEDGVCGYLVSSVEDCARRCLELLADPELRQRMGAAGRERVRDRFLITRNLRDYLRLFASLGTRETAAA